MKWFLIDKSKSDRPAFKDYRDWKPILRKEGRFQCVYCCVSEADFGGLRNFHVEHYRPKSKWPDLANDFDNLFYICSICNSFKGSDWPGEPTLTHDVKAYPCPCNVNYSDLIRIDQIGAASSVFVAGQYAIERLYLNRPQLRVLRKLWFLQEELSELNQEARKLVEASSKDVTRGLVLALIQVNNLLIRMRRAIPYEYEDVARCK